MPTSVMFFVFAGCALTVAGCASRADVADLQAVYGPKGVTFERRELAIDLNGDARPERVVLLADQRRGILLPHSVAELSRSFTVDGFAVFDGKHPSVHIFYQYADYGGFDLRLDVVEGRRLLVSDDNRNRIQSVWGWWTDLEAWPGWESKQREFDDRTQQWGSWKARDKTFVLVGK